VSDTSIVPWNVVLCMSTMIFSNISVMSGWSSSVGKSPAMESAELWRVGRFYWWKKPID